MILVDELAHTNAPGMRHAKRWQDIEELLTAGIDVYATVNELQHVESLNDVVAGISGVTVRETFPDEVFDRADDVVLIDLTPDETPRAFTPGKSLHSPASCARIGAILPQGQFGRFAGNSTSAHGRSNP